MSNEKNSIIPFKVTCLCPPVLSTLSGQTYAIFSSHWFKVDKSVTLEDLQSYWIKEKILITHGRNIMNGRSYRLKKSEYYYHTD